MTKATASIVLLPSTVSNFNVDGGFEARKKYNLLYSANPISIETITKKEPSQLEIGKSLRICHKGKAFTTIGTDQNAI